MDATYTEVSVVYVEANSYEYITAGYNVSKINKAISEMVIGL